MAWPRPHTTRAKRFWWGWWSRCTAPGGAPFEAGRPVTLMCGFPVARGGARRNLSTPKSRRTPITRSIALVPRKRSRPTHLRRPGGSQYCTHIEPRRPPPWVTGILAQNHRPPPRRDDDPDAWLELGNSDEPVNTQVDDGHPPAEGGCATSSESRPAATAFWSTDGVMAVSFTADRVRGRRVLWCGRRPSIVDRSVGYRKLVGGLRVEVGCEEGAGVFDVPAQRVASGVRVGVV